MDDLKKVAIMAAAMGLLDLAPPQPRWSPPAPPKKPKDRAKVKAARKQRHRK